RDLDETPGPRHALEFHQAAARIAQVLQHVRADEPLERLIREWPRDLVEIMDNIGARGRIEIHADRIRNADHAAPDVEGFGELSHAVRGDAGFRLAARRYSR